MASAVDSRLAYARLSAVATASRLPTATRGSNNSYTTSWDTTYILGPGTTVRAISRRLGLESTLIGVDLVKDGRPVAADVTEADILDALGGERATIVVTPIGGQGHFLGRGNQQISAEVVRRVGRDNIILVATSEKLTALGGELLVDTGDPPMDDTLSGYIRVVTGYAAEAVCRVAS